MAKFPALDIELLIQALHDAAEYTRSLAESEVVPGQEDTDPVYAERMSYALRCDRQAESLQQYYGRFVEASPSHLGGAAEAKRA